MLNTTEMYTKYSPIIILRNKLIDAQNTKEYLIYFNKDKDIKEELFKINLYINQCNESIIYLQEMRNKNIREKIRKLELNNLQVEFAEVN